MSATGDFPDIIKLSKVGNERLGGIEYEPDPDLRGLRVLDAEGQEVGTVEDLYVGMSGSSVRLIDVVPTASLDLGERRFPIPFQAVETHEGGEVRLNQSLEKVVASPEYGSELDLAPERQRELHDHYDFR